MPPNIPQFYGEFTFVLRLDGDTDEMTTGVGFQTDALTSLNDLAHSAYDAVQAEIMPLYGGEYSLIRCDVRANLTGEPFDEGTWAEITAGASGDGNALPQNNAMLIRKLTTGVGGLRAGRMYWPGLPNNEGNVSDNGVIAGAQVTAYQGAFTDLYNALVSIDGVEELFVFHQSGAPTEIAAFELDPVIATQRRRLRR